MYKSILFIITSISILFANIDSLNIPTSNTIKESLTNFTTPIDTSKILVYYDSRTLPRFIANYQNYKINSVTINQIKTSIIRDFSIDMNNVTYNGNTCPISTLRQIEYQTNMNPIRDILGGYILGCVYCYCFEGISYLAFKNFDYKRPLIYGFSFPVILLLADHSNSNKKHKINFTLINKSH